MEKRKNMEIKEKAIVERELSSLIEFTLNLEYELELIVSKKN